MENEYRAIFSVIDKYISEDTFCNIILDKCGADNVSFSGNAVIFDNETRKRLRFSNEITSLEYSDFYDCFLLNNDIEKQNISNDNQNFRLGPTNFIFFHEYNAVPNKTVATISEIIDYIGFESAQELRKALLDNEIPIELVDGLTNELSSQIASNKDNVISEVVLERMCNSFASADESDFRSLLTKIQDSIEPKFLATSLYEQDLISQAEYERLMISFDTKEQDDIQGVEFFLEPKAMLDLGVMDNSFVLVRDDDLIYKIRQTLDFSQKDENRSFSFLDLLDRVGNSHKYKKALVNFLMNTEKSPYEILRQAHTQKPKLGEVLGTDSKKEQSSGNVSGGNKTSGDLDSVVQDDKQDSYILESLTGLSEKERNIFDDALAYIRHSANPFFFTHQQYKDELERQKAISEKIVDEMADNDISKVIRKTMRAKTSKINKDPQVAYDKRLYESAYQQKQRRQVAFVNRHFKKITNSQLNTLWQNIGIKEQSAIEKLKDSFSKQASELLARFKNLHISSKSNLSNTSTSNYELKNQQETHFRPK